jgi:hypothetical protein
VVELDDVGLHADPLEERLYLQGIPDGGMAQHHQIVRTNQPERFSGLANLTSTRIWSI